jgi:hypothetical protein
MKKLEALALAMFRSAEADALIKRMGPIAAMWCIMDALRQGSKDVWKDLK